jgi:hypothetical protein
MDPDALPNGWLGPRPPLGKARPSRLTPDEQRTEFTLWAFARAPLIEGANLTRLDPLTRSLMTDRELINIDQRSRESHPLTDLPARLQNLRVWEAETRQVQTGRASRYFAIFNLSDNRVQLHISWADLHLTGRTHSLRAARADSRLSQSTGIELSLPPHGSAVYQVQ